MSLTEQFKLIHRAWRYRLEADKGGIRFLREHIHRGYTVLDIGAHKGGYTYWMKKATGSRGKVIAFEPQADGAALLKFLFGNRIVVERLAVSDTSGTRLLFVQPQNYDVSFEASLENRYTDAIAETVMVTTIDDYCRQHLLSPDFIKIDAEGHEFHILLGAKQILTKLKPVLLMECEARHIGINEMNRIFHELKELGYEGSFFFDGKKFPLGDFRIELHQDLSLLKKHRYANNFGFIPVKQ